MREIKFRVWDTDEKYMYNVKHKNLSLYPAHRYMVMQFTGLHDKNGREIYEGDVVSNSLGGIWAIWWNEEQAAYWGRRNKGHHDYAPFGRLNDLEVIGNIYENPDLITQPIV